MSFFGGEELVRAKLLHQRIDCCLIQTLSLHSRETHRNRPLRDLFSSSCFRSFRVLDDRKMSDIGNPFLLQTSLRARLSLARFLRRFLAFVLLDFCAALFVRLGHQIERGGGE